MRKSKGGWKTCAGCTTGKCPADPLATLHGVFDATSRGKRCAVQPPSDWPDNAAKRVKENEAQELVRWKDGGQVMRSSAGLADGRQAKTRLAFASNSRRRQSFGFARQSDAAICRYGSILDRLSSSGIAALRWSCLCFMLRACPHFLHSFQALGRN